VSKHWRNWPQPGRNIHWLDPFLIHHRIPRERSIDPLTLALNHLNTYFKILNTVCYTKQRRCQNLDLFNRLLTRRPEKAHKQPGGLVTRLFHTCDVRQYLGRIISQRTSRQSWTNTDHCWPLHAHTMRQSSTNTDHCWPLHTHTQWDSLELTLTTTCTYTMRQSWTNTDHCWPLHAHTMR